jgi:hypothetical protein
MDLFWIGWVGAATLCRPVAVSVPVQHGITNILGTDPEYMGTPSYLRLWLRVRRDILQLALRVLGHYVYHSSLAKTGGNIQRSDYN